ncbi:MAG: hypothetical protein ACRDIY_11020 [Chloroflexota bacterium]
MPLPTVAAHWFSGARRTLTLVAVLSFLLASILQNPAPAEAAGCQFSLGFATLHRLIPTAVGNCLTDETYNPTNGDGLQLTTDGLLVWRKADNFTAFTNGSLTWINGPFGLQVRSNDARFRWEPDVAPSNVDPSLSAAYQIAANSQFGSLIANVLAERIPVRLAALPTNVFGAFSIDPRTGQARIDVSSALADANPNDAAAVLIHEATHAYDFTHQPNFSTSQGCIQTELRARSNELEFWRDQFGPNGKQPALNQFERAENTELALAQTDLRALLAATFNTYRGECGL